MATLTFQVDSGEALVEEWADVTLTYSVSSTDAATTVSVSSIRIASSYNSSKTFSYSVTVGGTSVASGSVTVGRGATKTTSISGSKSTTRAHSASTVQVRASCATSGDTGSAYAYESVPAKPSYAVTYSANGGSGAPSSQTKWYGETLTLSSTKPSRSNYVFWHWNTSSSNGGTTYTPGASYTANAALSLYAIWNPLIQYNANGTGVGSMPSTQTKTYGTAITLSSNVPTRPGYAFDGWYTNTAGTGTRYAPGQSYTSNTALTLYAKWLKVPDAPRISSMLVTRCDANGTAADEGTYCKVTATWSVDTTSDTQPNNTGTVTGTIREDGSSSSRSITFSSGSSGTSGTAVALMSGCDIDRQYLVTITVTDAVTSTTRTDLLTRAKFVLDFHAGGNGMGVGRAAPANGFECAWDAQFDEDLTVLGNLEAGNLQAAYESTTATVASARDTWTVSSASARTYGHLCHLYLYVKNSSALTAGASATQVGTIASAYRPKSYVTFGCANGGGYITTGGAVYFRPFVDVSANSSFYIGVAYFI